MIKKIMFVFMLALQATAVSSVAADTNIWPMPNCYPCEPTGK